MNKTQYITMQEVRRDVPGFFKRIASGQKLTVIYHSKPLVTVKNANNSPQDDGGASDATRFLELAARARATAKSNPDPSASYKDLYHDGMAQKHGVS